MEEHEHKTGFYFVIIVSNRYVVKIAIDAFYEDNTIGNVCYWIAQKHQGKGYAKTALLHLTQWATQHTQLAYLQIRMEVTNTASRAVAQSTGAVYIKTIADYHASTGRVSTVEEYHVKLCTRDRSGYPTVRYERGVKADSPTLVMTREVPK